jgi:hypothetical protein
VSARLVSRDDIWPAHRIDALLDEVRALAPWVIVSGGFAWHLLCVPGHHEDKHVHDHKDIDLFVAPEDVAALIPVIAARGYKRVWTRFDRLPSAEDFRRYERHIETPQGLVKAQIDLFVKAMPSRTIDGIRIVEPSELLKLYRTIESPRTAWSVRQAASLLSKGVDPQGQPSLSIKPA